MRVETPHSSVDDGWLNAYRAANAEHLSSDPEFARWLANDYVPIAGGWQY